MAHEESEAWDSHLCANMDTTISEKLAEILIERGSIPIYHRFTKDFEAQEAWVKKFGEKTFVSCGIGKEKLAEVRKLFDMGLRVSVLMWRMVTLKRCSISLKS